MKKAIIIGASSGIGKALALTLAKKGYELGLMARRTELLESLQQEISTPSHISYLDVSSVPDALEKMEQMVQKMGEVDLIIFNSGIGFLNPKLDWPEEKQTIDVNVYGFCALAGFSYKYFARQGRGHLVGISSIAALRGNSSAPAYHASKAFMSSYLAGLHKKAFQDGLPIAVTDIKPGYVDTAMAQGPNKFWVASPTTAAEQIYSAIEYRRFHAYITRRWRLIGWLIKLLPEWIYQKV